MRALEQAADSQGLSYAQMMENAGQAVAAWLLRKAAPDRSILVLVGPGNNGGDGLVAARHLHQGGTSVVLYVWKRDVEEDKNWELVQSQGVPAFWSEQDRGYRDLRRLVVQSDWIIDALLGTGVSRPASGALKDILSVVTKGIEQRRASRPLQFASVLPVAHETGADMGPLVLALDVPSGLNSDTGAVDPATIPADVTITLAFPKIGQFLFPGRSYVGELVVADIGIPTALSAEIAAEVSTPQLIQSLLPPRPIDAHKGTFGKVMVVAGSSNYTGAAYLAARAATRVGAGLVTLGIAESLHAVLAGKVSETTFLLLPHDMGALTPSAVRPLLEQLETYDALLLGPGLGRHEKTVAFVAQLLGVPLSPKKAHLGFVEPSAAGAEKGPRLPPLIIDADALNALAGIDGWPEALPSNAALTPHPGEMARLLRSTVAEVESQRIDAARHAAEKWNTIVVLKGAHTVVAAPPALQSRTVDGRVYVNPFANPALATAGSGDVLAGAIAGFVAQGLPPFDAAIAGTYVHGLAGELVKEDIGQAGAVAGDLLDRLPLSIRRIAGA